MNPVLFPQENPSRLFKIKRIHSLLWGATTFVLLLFISFWSVFLLYGISLFLTSFSLKFSSILLLGKFLGETFLLLLLATLFALPLSIFSIFSLENSSLTAYHFFQIHLKILLQIPPFFYGIFIFFLLNFLAIPNVFLFYLLVLFCFLFLLFAQAFQNALHRLPPELYSSGFALGLSPSRIGITPLLSQAFPEFLSGICFALARVLGEASLFLLIVFSSSAQFPSFLALQIFWGLSQTPPHSPLFLWVALFLLVLSIHFLQLCAILLSPSFSKKTHVIP
jgi:ABC-type phosphate transport system permease subunit